MVIKVHIGLHACVNCDLINFPVILYPEYTDLDMISIVQMWEIKNISKFVNYARKPTLNFKLVGKKQLNIHMPDVTFTHSEVTVF